MSIENKWALVTGSSRGVGRQIALGLAEMGCHVIVHARHKKNLAETLDKIKKYPVKIAAVEGSLENPKQIDTVIQKALALSGGIDILYNNAAIMTPWTDLFKTKQEAYELSMQVNLYAIMQLCQGLAPYMMQKKWGRIINVTSGIGFIPHLDPYCVSKAALDKYTGNLAEELKESGILVNLLDPGWLKTDLGGPQAPHEVTSVLPGALVPALLPENGEINTLFRAQDYAGQ